MKIRGKKTTSDKTSVTLVLGQSTVESLSGAGLPLSVPFPVCTVPCEDIAAPKVQALLTDPRVLFALSQANSTKYL